MYFRFALSFGDVELMISDLTENCKLQFSQQFRRFCTQCCHRARKKLGGWLGARTGDGESSDLPSGLELDVLRCLGIENRGISRAIGMQFVFTDLI